MSAPTPDQVLPGLLESLPGPWTLEPSGLPPGGPQRWWRGPLGVALAGPPARVAAERAGWARLPGHPARPPVLAEADDVRVYPPLGTVPGDPASVVAAWPRGRAQRLHGSVEALLAGLPGRTDLFRGLAHLGEKRKYIDRLRMLHLEIQTNIGHSLGGISGDWIRQGPDAPLALRWADAHPEGWSALDLASTGLACGEDLHDLHAEGLTVRASADRAYDLALLRRAVDEAVLGQDALAAHAAAEAMRRLLPGPDPVEVDISLLGAPDWLDPALWIPSSGRVAAPRARWLLHALDGLVVGGHTLTVHTDPPLRAGRRPPYREDREIRRKRLFSRWDQGVRSDDEGLWSATPEALAMELVAGLRGSVIDAGCGIGSLCIALARTPGVTSVTAVDSSRERLDMARHNAALYGVADRVRFVHGDAVECLRAGRWDAAVLDPPWGGPAYDRGSVSLAALPFPLAHALAACPARVRIKLPRSVEPAELAALAPRPWRWRPAVDDRGMLKFLVAVAEPNALGYAHTDFLPDKP